MPFTTISTKIRCDDLLPLYPTPLSSTFTSLHVPTSISFYKVPPNLHLWVAPSCYCCFSIEISDGLVLDDLSLT